jgi:hypothetical protein
MKPKNLIGKAIIGLLVLFSFVLSACIGTQMMVAPEDSISLVQGGPHAGSWESSDVNLNYQYVYQSGTLRLNFGGGAKRGYDQLVIWIRFFDAQGKYLQTETVFNSGFRQKFSQGRGSNEKIFEIPKESTQFSFQSMLKNRTNRR